MSSLLRSLLLITSLYCASAWATLPLPTTTSKSTPAQTSEADVANQLADVLNDPKKREVLIKALRQIAGDEAGSQSGDKNAEDKSKASDSGEESSVPAGDGSTALSSISDTVNNLSKEAQTVLVRPSVITDKISNRIKLLNQQMRQRFKQLYVDVQSVFHEAVKKFSSAEILSVLMKSLIAIALLNILMISMQFFARKKLTFREKPTSFSWRYIITRTIRTGIILAITLFISTIVLGFLGVDGVIIQNLLSAFALNVALVLLFSAPFTPHRLPLHLRALINLFTYGFYFVIPVISAYFSSAWVNVLSVLIALVGLALLIISILELKRRVRAILYKQSRQKAGFSRMVYQHFAYFWQIWGFIALFFLYLSQIFSTVEHAPFVWKATFTSICYLVLGLLIMGYCFDNAKLPQKVHPKFAKTFPRLGKIQDRITTIALKVGYFLSFIIMTLVILSTWKIISVPVILTSKVFQNIVHRILGIVIIIICARIIWRVLNYCLDRWVSKQPNHSRIRTLLGIFKNALSIVIIVITAMMVLMQLGVNPTVFALVTGGVTVAVGFGAQTLVKDFITGIFIQVENAMNIGDYVKVDSFSGVVERISVRAVAIRDTHGVYHIIPFSSVTTVSNYMRDFAYHKAEYGISYSDDIDHACAVLHEAFAELKTTHGQYLLSDLDISGVEALADSSVNIRIRIKTKPGDQWKIKHAYNRLVKLHFDRAGICIPFPQRSVILVHADKDKDKENPTS